MTDIKEVLPSLGYNLSDRGDYWQSTAVYRNGDNPTALQIYKDSGVWRDYVTGENFMPFKALIEKTIGTNNSSELKKYLDKLDLDSNTSYTYESESKIEQEKIAQGYRNRLIEALDE